MSRLTRVVEGAVQRRSRDPRRAITFDGQPYEVLGVMPAEFSHRRAEAQSPFNSMTVVIRTRDEDPMSLIPTARQIVASIDPSLPIASVQTLEHVVAESVGQPRLMSALTGLFGALAGCSRWWASTA